MNKNTLTPAVLVLMLVMAAAALSSCLAVPSVPYDPNPSANFSVSPVATPALSALISPIAMPADRVGSSGKATGSPAQGLSSQSTVSGVLLQNRDAPVPAGVVILYLGSVHFNAQGTPFAAGLDKQTAPRTQSDELGRFAFSSVPDGTYVLILDRVYEAFVLNDPTTGKDMLVKVDGGQPVDLGNLVYRTLPGDGLMP